MISLTHHPSPRPSPSPSNNPQVPFLSELTRHPHLSLSCCCCCSYCSYCCYCCYCMWFCFEALSSCTAVSSGVSGGPNASLEQPSSSSVSPIPVAYSTESRVQLDSAARQPPRGSSSPHPRGLEVSF